MAEEKQLDVEEGTQVKKVHNKVHINKCVGFCIAGILVLAILITTLSLTVFRVKEPEIIMKRIMFPQLSDPDLLATATMNVVAETSMKNPNIASFRYGNSTTFVYYHGTQVGKGHVPSGIAKARCTKDMNVTMVVDNDKLFDNPKFINDLGSGVLVLSSYTRLDGKVKILNIFEKLVVIKMNCSITTNITSFEILDQTCKENVLI